ncbi:MAG: hypothetical protein LBB67_01665 [Oscillospiraceae bacterium]|jgi:hypothetical protein|nr:hypothetical protein [Oscillospiraceae bacterium]
MFQSFISFFVSLLFWFLPNSTADQTADLPPAASVAQGLVDYSQLIQTAVTAQTVAPQETEPIEIRTANDFRAIAHNLNGTYILMKNIVWSGGVLTPIGSAENPFTGTLNGNGFKISGLAVNQTVSLGTGAVASYGIFAKNQGEITGLWLENCSVRVHIESAQTIGATTVYAGLIAGMNAGLIEDCYLQGDLTLDSIDTLQSVTLYAGGVTGFNLGGVTQADICNVRNDAAVSASGTYRTYAGGIAGYAEVAAPSYGVLLSNCVNRGNVLAASGSMQCLAGGIVGDVSSVTLIERCANFGQIAGESASHNAYVGGIGGRFVSTPLENAVNFGTVTANSNGASSRQAAAGGLIGYAHDAAPYNCYATGAIDSNSENAANNVGALIGYVYAATAGADYSVNCYMLQGTADSAYGSSTRAAIVLRDDQLSDWENFAGFDRLTPIWEWIVVDGADELGVTAYLANTKQIPSPRVIPTLESIHAGTVVDDDRRLIYGLLERIPFQQLTEENKVDRFSLANYLAIADAKGALTTTGTHDYIATGDVITLTQNGNSVASYTVIIFGDCSPNGLVDAEDIALARTMLNIPIAPNGAKNLDPTRLSLMLYGLRSSVQAQSIALMQKDAVSDPMNPAIMQATIAHRLKNDLDEFFLS